MILLSQTNRGGEFRRELPGRAAGRARARARAQEAPRVLALTPAHSHRHPRAPINSLLD